MVTTGSDILNKISPDIRKTDFFLQEVEVIKKILEIFNRWYM